MENTLGLIIPLLLMFVVFYFLLIRPQQKRQREVRDMQAALQKGDMVVTIGGLHGQIDAIDEDTVIIVVEDGTRFTYDRASIRNIKND